MRLREPEEYRGYWGVVKPVEDGGNLEEGRFMEIRDDGVRHCGAPMALGEVAKRNAGKDRRRDATLTREYGVSRQDAETMIGQLTQTQDAGWKAALPRQEEVQVSRAA